MSRLGKSVLFLATTVAFIPPPRRSSFWSNLSSRGPLETAEAGFAPPLTKATSDEERANVAWAMRAGLNVAALLCQFSPLLRTVTLSLYRPLRNFRLPDHSGMAAELP